MKKQQGFAHAVLIIGMAVALLGALGFIFWQNFIYEEPVATKTEVISTDDADKEVDETEQASTQKLELTLNSREVTIDVSDAKYDDIVAVFDSENGYYDVYSKDLLARVNESNGKPAASVAGCNATVVIDTYSSPDVSGIRNKVGEANGKFVHAGFLGPCQSSGDEDLSNEMLAFRDYIVEKTKEALQ